MKNRKELILKEIVDGYIDTGEPVSSRLILDEYDLDYSSATVRNDMHELEEEGYLKKPYTSGGRVPTIEGYRYFVSWLIELSGLSGEEQRAIVEAYEFEQQNTERLLGNTASLLASITGYAGFVLGPDLAERNVKYFTMTQLDKRHLMAILVTDIGLVENRVIKSERDITEEELDQIVSLLSDRLEGMQLKELKELRDLNLNEEGYSDSDRFLLKCDDEEKKISIDDTWGKKVELELTDFEKPVIDDKSDPGPKTGKEYSFNMVIEDKSEIIKTKIRYKFDNKKIHNEDIVNVKENEYEMTIDVPEDAKELSYNFTAVDLAGNTKITKTKTLEVEDVIKPVAKIGKDISVSIYEDFTLNGDNSYDNIGIKSYRWMIGSETIEGRSISHNYSSLGTEDIKLKVEDHAGNTNSTSIKINVFDKERPEAVAEVDASIDLNEEAVLDATGSSDNGNIINYTWTIEELDKVLYGKNKDVSFESPGRYNIDLKIVDSGNNTDSDFKTIEVFDRTSPEVKVDYRSEVDVGEEIDFDASDSTDNHKIRSYIWDFDDGYKENGEKVKHAFETEGNYTVRLTVEDESGNTITVDHEVTVKKVESEKSSPEKETPGFQIMYLPVGLIIALYIREKKKGR